MSIPDTIHLTYLANPALSTWGSNLGVCASDRVTVNPLQKLSGTTVVVPTPGVLSGISSEEGEHSVLPQTDNQVAADILVVIQQGQAGNRICKRYVHRPRAARFKGIIVESKKRMFDTRM
jgi:hypothetical protein